MAPPNNSLRSDSISIDMQQPSPDHLIINFAYNFQHSLVYIRPSVGLIQEETICSEDGSESYLHFQRGYL